MALNIVEAKYIPQHLAAPQYPALEDLTGAPDFQAIPVRERGLVRLFHQALPNTESANTVIGRFAVGMMALSTVATAVQLKLDDISLKLFQLGQENVPVVGGLANTLTEHQNIQIGIAAAAGLVGAGLLGLVWRRVATAVQPEAQEQQVQ